MALAIFELCRFIMGPGAGLFVMSPIIQTLLNATTSWRMTLIIMAGITFVTCLLPCSFGTNIANDKCQINTSADKNCEVRSSLVALATAGRVSSSQLCSTLTFSYLKNKEFVIYVIAGVICFCGMTVPNVHMVSTRMVIFCFSGGKGNPAHLALIQVGN